MALYPPGYCRTCRAPVIWADDAFDDLLALDAEARHDGTHTLRPRPGRTPLAERLEGADLSAAWAQGAQLYLPHEFHCPSSATQIADAA